jgi:hypothetical protein
MRPRVSQSSPPRFASSAAPLRTFGDAKNAQDAAVTAMTANEQKKEGARFIGKLLK